MGLVYTCVSMFFEIKDIMIHSFSNAEPEKILNISFFSFKLPPFCSSCIGPWTRQSMPGVCQMLNMRKIIKSFLFCLYRPRDKEANACYGGVARRVTALRNLRRIHPNLVLLDAGDQFQGTLWFMVHKGRAASHFMNRIQYDAMVCE